MQQTVDGGEQLTDVGQIQLMKYNKATGRTKHEI